MKEKSINCKAWEVRAFLEKRKTQMRFLIDPQPIECGFGRNALIKPYCTGTDWPLAYYEMRGSCWNSSKPLKCPYAIGQRLWVRETWAPFDDDVILEKETSAIGYKADEKWNEYSPYSGDGTSDGNWKPSIHMPRWASRIDRVVTGIRAERLQDISEEDAFDEGCFALGDCDCTAKVQYQNLWDSINGKTYPWASNPCLWVIEFDS